MKKKFSKKLVLKKETVTALTDETMALLKGGTVFFYCTESCTVFYYCCDTKTRPLEENREQANG